MKISVCLDTRIIPDFVPISLFLNWNISKHLVLGRSSPWSYGSDIPGLWLAAWAGAPPRWLLISASNRIIACFQRVCQINYWGLNVFPAKPRPLVYLPAWRRRWSQNLISLRWAASTFKTMVSFQFVSHRRRINTICLHTCDKLLSVLSPPHPPTPRALWVHVDLFSCARCLACLIASPCRIWGRFPSLFNLPCASYFERTRGSSPPSWEVR